MLLVMLGVLAAVFTAAAPSASALLSCNYQNHSESPTLTVKHRPDIGPYAHEVDWHVGYYDMRRWRLWVQYPGTTESLVRDVNQYQQAYTCDGCEHITYWIIYTPSYRPADGRYWWIYTWDPEDGSRWRCGSAHVYD
jgi:hypothetical protein